MGRPASFQNVNTKTKAHRIMTPMPPLPIAVPELPIGLGPLRSMAIRHHSAARALQSLVRFYATERELYDASQFLEQAQWHTARAKLAEEAIMLFDPRAQPGVGRS